MLTGEIKMADLLSHMPVYQVTQTLSRKLSVLGA
jgi:hypothetical protein